MNDRVTPASARGKEVITRVVVGGSLLLGVVAGLWQLQPPAAVPATAPAEAFSSGRARRHVEAIARAPHPIGSAAHDVVRDYLVGQLQELGLAAEVQTTAVASLRDGEPSAATVQNVMARLRGAAPTKAVALVAHYDSVPWGPGASDDGAGVAAILETMRALRAGPRLRNDVIALFSDGEEAGLLGAQAFEDEHPWARDIGLVLNFEARGTSGPTFMFETSPRNGWLVREFATAAPFPLANSLTYDVYKRLPNDTDFSVFKEHAVPGLNFAFIDDSALRYHTALDRIENVDERSLQHHGTFALSLVRHFGELPLADLPANGGAGAADDAIYFNAVGRWLVYYPRAWALPLAGIAAVVFGMLLVVAVRSGRLTVAGMALGFAALAASLLGAQAVVWGLQHLLQLGETTYYHRLYIGGLVALAVALHTGLYAAVAAGARRTRRAWALEPGLYAGALVWWLLLLAGSVWLLPGASYLFLWPLLFGLLGLGGWWVAGARRPGSPGGAVVLAVAGLPGLLLLVPIIYAVFVALTLAQPGPAVALLVLLLGLLIPQLSVLAAPHRWWAAAAAAAVGVGFLMAAQTRGADRQHPRWDFVFYGLDADAQTAFWAAAGDHLDDWSAQFLTSGPQRTPLSDFLPLVSRAFLHSPAPTAGLPAPRVDRVDDGTNDTAGGVRRMHLRISSVRHAPVLSIYVGAKADVLAAEVEGRPVGQPPPAGGGSRDPWQLRYYAPPPEGVVLTLQLRGTDPVKMAVVDESYDLPQFAGQSLPPRPEHIMPNTTTTLVRRSFTL